MGHFQANAFFPDRPFMSSIDASIAAVFPGQSEKTTGSAADAAQQKALESGLILQKAALAAPLASLKTPAGEQPSLRLSSILAFAGLQTANAEESRGFFEQALAQENVQALSPSGQGFLAQWGEWACHSDRPGAVEALFSMGLDWRDARVSFDPQTDATIEFLRSGPGRAVRDASDENRAQSPLLSRLLSLDARQSLARLWSLGELDPSAIAEGAPWAQWAARSGEPLSLLSAALSHEAWGCLDELANSEIAWTQGALDQALWVCAQNPAPLGESWFGWIHWLLERGANPFRPWPRAFQRRQSDDGPISVYASPAQKGPVLRDIAHEAGWDAPVFESETESKADHSPVMDCSPLQMALREMSGRASPSDNALAGPSDTERHARQALAARIDAGIAETGWDCARAFLMRMVDTEAAGSMAAASYDGWVHALSAIDWAQAPNGSWGESPLMFLMSLSLTGALNSEAHPFWNGERAFKALMALDSCALMPAESPGLPSVAELALILAFRADCPRSRPMTGPLKALSEFARRRLDVRLEGEGALRALGARELARVARAVVKKACENVKADADRADLVVGIGGWSVKWADRGDTNNWIVFNLLSSPDFLAMCDPATLPDWMSFSERWKAFETACDELHKGDGDKPSAVEKQRSALDALELSAQWWMQRLEAAPSGPDLALEPKSDKKNGGSASSGAKRL